MRPEQKFVVPPLPPILAIEDRANGHVWFLTHRQSDDRIAINDDVQRFNVRGQVQRFDAYGGPYMRISEKIAVRLFIRNGRIGYETVPFAVSNPVTRSRRGPTAYSLSITRGQYVEDGDRLGWEVQIGEPSL